MKRKLITIETKIQILDRLQNQERVADISRHFEWHELTIRTIKQNVEKIRGAVSSGSSVLARANIYNYVIYNNRKTDFSTKTLFLCFYHLFVACFGGFQEI